MSRQINPGVFGDTFGSTGVTHSFEPLPLIDHSDTGPALDELAEKIEKQKYETEQTLKSICLRLEKAIQKTGLLDDRLNYIVKEINERLTYMMSRMKEKSFSDTKIEALIERHNQIVHSFELRISQSQKVIENQALQLSTQQALIDDARRQIEKLKRL